MRRILLARSKKGVAGKCRIKQRSPRNMSRVASPVVAHEPWCQNVEQITLIILFGITYDYCSCTCRWYSSGVESLGEAAGAHSVRSIRFKIYMLFLSARCSHHLRGAYIYLLSNSATIYMLCACPHQIRVVPRCRFWETVRLLLLHLICIWRWTLEMVCSQRRSAPGPASVPYIARKDRGGLHTASKHSR